MALRALTPGIRLSGLERTARLAGEAFGHEELGRLDHLRATPASSRRLRWWIVTLLAVIGLIVLVLR